MTQYLSLYDTSLNKKIKSTIERYYGLTDISIYNRSANDPTSSDIPNKDGVVWVNYSTGCDLYVDNVKVLDNVSVALYDSYYKLDVVGNVGSYYFQGYLDHMRIFKKPLTLSEVDILYNEI